jgi:guanylate kinase
MISRPSPGETRRGVLLVISSPSGAGKTSLARRLMSAFPSLDLSVSATTRPPRPGEADGREYHFVLRERFDEMIGRGDFLEWAEVHEHRYGSPRAPVLERLSAGGDVLFDIDWQGAEAIHAALPADTVRVFILPPSLTALETRLRGRAQDAADVIDRRLARARGEIEHWIDYDYVIVNDVLDDAYARLASIYVAERERRARNPWLQDFVSQLLGPG